MRTFDIAERRARLARRHRLAPGHRAPDVVSATDSMVCLHATDPATVYLSAWARVDGLVTADVDKALYDDRSLVKHLCMRRTLFVFNTEVLGVIQAAASERVADQERRRLAKDVEKAGLYPDGTAWLAEASVATLDGLAALGEANSTELRAAVPLLEGSLVYAPGKSYGGNAPIGPRVLITLSAAGKILRGTNQGSWNVSRPRWVTTRRWLGAEPELPTESEARAELVRRWLYAFGPATVTDIKWWLGSTMTTTRTALADTGAVEVELHGRPGVALFDSTGNGGMTAWWDGRIVGGWNQTPTGEVYLQLLDDVGSEALAALESQAALLTEWLGGLRVAPRFPSPLSTIGSPSTRPLRRGGLGRGTGETT